MSEPMSNFTPRAQQVLALARKEADRFHHNYVGTEHLLLGLINLGQGVAVNVCRRWGSIWTRSGKPWTNRSVLDRKPNHPVTSPTPRESKRSRFGWQKEAKGLNHSYVGTEHILLGLLREGEGVAARVLKSLDVDVDQVSQRNSLGIGS